MLEQHRHQLSLHETPDLFVDADEVRLTQIISNLLTNAARYTPAKGRIELHTARDGDQAAIRVVDNGRGMDARLLANADLEAELRQLAKTFDDRRSRRAFGAVDEALTALERNASPKLVADWLILQL